MLELKTIVEQNQKARYEYKTSPKVRIIVNALTNLTIFEYIRNYYTKDFKKIL